MKMLLSAARIRRIISDCNTAADIQATLRAHCIPFSYETAAGNMSIRIPARRGCIRIYNAETARAPFLAALVPPVSAGYNYTVPQYRND